ncbi:MAG: helix-turn-helix domain-containing protein [Clostridia bacterium]|nr:helix-turn-helix domain-containing protein [Clostridia bacterium]
MAKDTVRTELGKLLVTLRKEKGWKQQDVATLLGIKRNTYSRYETDTQPPFPILKKLSEIYNVSCDMLLGVADVDYSELIKNKAPLRFSTYTAYNQETNDTLELSDSEIELVKRFRNLSKEKQEALLIFTAD